MFRSLMTVKFIIGLPVAKPNQNISRVYVENRQTGGQVFQKPLPVPFLLQWGRVLKEGEGMGYLLGDL